ALEKAACGRRVVKGALLQGFGEGLQRSQRRAQLMRNVADEVPPYGFQMPQAGEVLEEQQDAARKRFAERRGHCLQEDAPGGDFDRGRNGFTALLALLPE